MAFFSFHVLSTADSLAAGAASLTVLPCTVRRSLCAAGGLCDDAPRTGVHSDVFHLRPTSSGRHGWLAQTVQAAPPMHRPSQPLGAAAAAAVWPAAGDPSERLAADALAVWCGWASATHTKQHATWPGFMCCRVGLPQGHLRSHQRGC